MAHPEVIKAQAATLDEWASTWARDKDEGAEEVAFLLKRVSRLMRRIADPSGKVEVPEPPAARAEPTLDPREG